MSEGAWPDACGPFDRHAAAAPGAACRMQPLPLDASTLRNTAGCTMVIRLRWEMEVQTQGIGGLGCAARQIVTVAKPVCCRCCTGRRPIAFGGPGTGAQE